MSRWNHDAVRSNTSAHDTYTSSQHKIQRLLTLQKSSDESHHSEQPGVLLCKIRKEKLLQKKTNYDIVNLKKSFVASIFQIINRLTNAHQLVTRRTCIRNHRDHTSLRRMSTMGPISRLKVLRSMDINWHRLENIHIELYGHTWSSEKDHSIERCSSEANADLSHFTSECFGFLESLRLNPNLRVGRRCHDTGSPWSIGKQGELPKVVTNLSPVVAFFPVESTTFRQFQSFFSASWGVTASNVSNVTSCH